MSEQIYSDIYCQNDLTLIAIHFGMGTLSGQTGIGTGQQKKCQAVNLYAGVSVSVSVSVCVCVCVCVFVSVSVYFGILAYRSFLPEC